MAIRRNKGGVGVLIVLALLGLVVLAIKTCRTAMPVAAPTVQDNSPADWRSHPVVYTKHARCRMECRHISEEQVREILAHGTINEQKSKEEADEATGRCDSYALEGRTSDGQQVRIVFGACPKITKVITAIDLEKDYTCDCR
ncbi:MAG: DUF4258 domain-containing protein [Bacteroidetes bacterium]|nr:DUF4258 domain-containing protein [Bacteroidota bacterium]